MSCDDHWAPLTKRARVLVVGDLALSVERGKVWRVEKVETNAFDTTITLAGVTRPRVVHPDTAITVLAPVTERDGLLLLRAEFGAQLMQP